MGTTRRSLIGFFLILSVVGSGARRIAGSRSLRARDAFGVLRHRGAKQAGRAGLRDADLDEPGGENGPAGSGNPEAKDGDVKKDYDPGDKKEGEVDRSTPQDVLTEQGLRNRAERLSKSPTKTLWHRTSPEGCKGIGESGFKMGTKGEMGAAIYGAYSEEDTAKKSMETGGPTTQEGSKCLVKFTAKVGNQKRVKQKCAEVAVHYKGPDLLKEGYDSAWQPNGCSSQDPEVAIYFPDMIIDGRAYSLPDKKELWHKEWGHKYRENNASDAGGQDNASQAPDQGNLTQGQGNGSNATGGPPPR